MKIQFGCAPINWTNDDLPSLGGELTYQQCLSEMALANYKGSEGGCKYPKDYETLKKALDLRNLVICNMWFSSNFTTFKNEETYQAFEKHMDFTYSLGARVVGVGECGVTVHGNEATPLFSKAPILTDEQMKNLAEGLNELGRRAKRKGMKVCFHYHVGTGIQTREEIDKIMSLTDPELVYMLFDTGHITVAGYDAVDLIKTYIDRVGHIHVKDVRKEVLNRLKAEDHSFLWGVKEGLFTVPGDKVPGAGTCVDWDGVFGVIKNSNYDGWIVVEAEQDPAKADPLEYAQIARAFMKEKLGC
ncbi:myo-inosose-2 dehydratase [Candidatus Epulonipiscium fishelsonii]|uniref:Myo-inosose-2 dehydratase n=1 Tax=Candidatus Epulonipiscium fishelsonii TaxID=77094 RepID=A0ACC8XBR5_9FIRM|nr:myo-inosose-2 dehydratase [Epulopiscium sp. SCG-B05WGA-EpuloA1]ONI40087.1 myo-inosose-2 dehydratase [Epulopiscium sp. SCG-B11WGA-EpuloA1]